MGNRKDPRDLNSWTKKREGKIRDERANNPLMHQQSHWDHIPPPETAQIYMHQNSQQIPRLNGTPQPYIEALCRGLDDRYIFASARIKGINSDYIRNKLLEIAGKTNPEHLMQILRRYEQAAERARVPEEQSPTWQALMLLRDLEKSEYNSKF